MFGFEKTQIDKDILDIGVVGDVNKEPIIGIKVNRYNAKYKILRLLLLAEQMKIYKKQIAELLKKNVSDDEEAGEAVQQKVAELEKKIAKVKQLGRKDLSGNKILTSPSAGLNNEKNAKETLNNIFKENNLLATLQILFSENPSESLSSPTALNDYRQLMQEAKLPLQLPHIKKKGSTVRVEFGDDLSRQAEYLSNQLDNICTHVKNLYKGDEYVDKVISDISSFENADITADADVEDIIKEAEEKVEAVEEIISSEVKPYTEEETKNKYGFTIQKHYENNVKDGKENKVLSAITVAGITFKPQDKQTIAVSTSNSALNAGYGYVNMDYYTATNEHGELRRYYFNVQTGFIFETPDVDITELTESFDCRIFNGEKWLDNKNNNVCFSHKPGQGGAFQFSFWDTDGNQKYCSPLSNVVAVLPPAFKIKFDDNEKGNFRPAEYNRRLDKLIETMEKNSLQDLSDDDIRQELKVLLGLKGKNIEGKIGGKIKRVIENGISASGVLTPFTVATAMLDQAKKEVHNKKNPKFREINVSAILPILKNIRKYGIMNFGKKEVREEIFRLYNELFGIKMTPKKRGTVKKFLTEDKEIGELDKLTIKRYTESVDGFFDNGDYLDSEIKNQNGDVFNLKELFPFFESNNKNLLQCFEYKDGHQHKKIDQKRCKFELTRSGDHQYKFTPQTCDTDWGYTLLDEGAATYCTNASNRINGLKGAFNGDITGIRGKKHVDTILKFDDETKGKIDNVNNEIKNQGNDSRELNSLTDTVYDVAKKCNNGFNLFEEVAHEENKLKDETKKELLESKSRFSDIGKIAIKKLEKIQEKKEKEEIKKRQKELEEEEEQEESLPKEHNEEDRERMQARMQEILKRNAEMERKRFQNNVNQQIIKLNEISDKNIFQRILHYFLDFFSKDYSLYKNAVKFVKQMPLEQLAQQKQLIEALNIASEKLYARPCKEIQSFVQLNLKNTRKQQQQKQV